VLLHAASVQLPSEEWLLLIQADWGFETRNAELDRRESEAGDLAGLRPQR
jgi:hypothetical protein